MRIAIIGAGAMGSLFGGRLSAVADVTLVDPWTEHIETIRERGLEILTSDGAQLYRLEATTDAVGVPMADLALILVKSHRTREAADQAARILKPQGLALTLQNGVGNGEVIGDVVGADRVILGVTSHGATLLGPGRVRHAGQGPTHLAARPEMASRVEEVAATFTKAGFETHVSQELDSLVWGKLIVNVGINALTALLRVPNGLLAELDGARAVMKDTVHEAVAVARARGITLPYDDPLAQVLAVCRATAANRSSMLQDALRGVPTEIDVINGAIVVEGARLSVPTPVNRAIVGLVKAMEASYDRRVRSGGQSQRQAAV